MKKLTILFILLILFMPIASAVPEYYTRTTATSDLNIFQKIFLGITSIKEQTAVGQFRGCSEYPDESIQFTGRTGMWLTCKEAGLINLYKMTPDSNYASGYKLTFLKEYQTTKQNGEWTYFKTGLDSSQRYMYECYYCTDIGETCSPDGAFMCLTDTSEAKCVNGFWVETECGNNEFCNPNTRKCEAEPDCREQWSCTSYSECKDGTQTRICMDANKCGTTEYKPKTETTCTEDTTTDTECTTQQDCWDIYNDGEYAPYTCVENKCLFMGNDDETQTNNDYSEDDTSFVGSVKENADEFMCENFGVGCDESQNTTTNENKTTGSITQENDNETQTNYIIPILIIVGIIGFIIYKRRQK